MDAHAVTHPTDKILSSYGLGKLDDRSADAVNKHLEQCTSCRNRVAEMSADSFLGRIREAQKSSDHSMSGQSQPGKTKSYKGKNGPIPPPANTLPPGLANNPDYEIKRELGRGGMGVVYLAHNTLMDRDEVLKVMGRQIMERPGVLDRFLREIRAVAKLRHPNIVTAYHASRLGESIVFAMEYVEGADLSRLVKAKGPLPVGYACNFIHQAALGLQHAHEEGLVHRDIKPGNLMFSKQGGKVIVKVLDFGLAKATREEKIDSALTYEGQALGTPDFIAPEQILDAPNADIRADIYSLGGTFFYLLTGRPPFEANSVHEVYEAHISRDAGMLNLIRPQVPVEVAALVAKMLAKEPGLRFQTPCEIAESLIPFFDKRSVKLKAPSAEASPTAWSTVGEPERKAVSTPTQPATGAVSPPIQTLKANEPTVVHVRWESLIEFQRTDSSIEALPSVSALPRPQWLRTTAAVGALMLGLFAVLLGVVVKVQTPHGVIVLKNVPQDSEIFVNRNKILFTWAGAGTPIVVRAVPGQNTIEVKKDGFMTSGKMVTVKLGGQEEISVHLEPLAVEPSAKKGVDARGSNANEAPKPSAPPVASIDLLSMIDVRRDTTRGQWKRLNSSLVSVAGQYDVIQVPGHPPEEYQLEIMAERIEGKNDLQIGVVCGQSQAVIVVDGWGGQISGVSWLDGRFANGNDTTHDGPVFVDVGPTRLVVTVRKNQIQLTANGQSIINWRGEDNRLSLIEDLGVARDSLFLAVQHGGTYRIDTVRLTSLSKPSREVRVE